MDIFRSPKFGPIAGCMVTEGMAIVLLIRVYRTYCDLRGRAGVIASIQGRRERSSKRYGVWHRREELYRRKGGDLIEVYDVNEVALVAVGKTL